MRTKLFLPLMLGALIGCDGRYNLGDLSDAVTAGASGSNSSGTSGTSGTSNGGSANANSAGTSGNAGSANGGSSGSSEAGSAGASGSTDGGSGGTGPLNPSRWLALETFVSTTSTQTELSLVDLVNPGAVPIILESQAATIDSFSPDGHWLLYRVFSTADLSDLYLVNIAVDPSTYHFALTTSYDAPCKWAPDSSRLACIKVNAATDTPASEAVYFDTSSATLGAEQSLGEGERDLAFLDASTLVYGFGVDDFARVAWQGQTHATPQTLGVGGGLISQQSPDGGRAFVKRTDPSDAGQALVDFRAGQATAIDGKYAFSISPSFEIGFASVAPGSGEVGEGKYSFWVVNGVQPTDVAEEPITQERGINPAFQIFGRTVARLLNGRVTVTTLGNSSIALEDAVAGDYSNVNWLNVDPTGTWLYFGTAELDGQNQFIASSTKHYLSRLDPTGPSAAHLIGQGYLGQVVRFSPDGQHLLLAGYDTSSSVPMAFHLFDLSVLAPGNSDPGDYTLDLPFNWSDPVWSPDSRYLSFIGGAPQTGSRPNYVVDAEAPTAAPRLVIECGPGTPSSPTCPVAALFQPPVR
ncbi:MAG TPA: hypothetical protein VGM44_09180 [Polyangiaceae bacterium]|jgi:Tol biopolymer transport system component